MTKALALALLTVLAACSGGDDEASPSTPAVTTEVPAVTSAPGTTEPPTTAAPTTPPPTEPAPPTTTEDDLKAVIAADVEAALLANYAALVDPSVEALPAVLSAVAAPGSPVEASLTAYIGELVSLGDGIVPNDPDVLVITVEQVELDASSPQTVAVVTVCEVENRVQQTLAKNAPNSVPIPVDGSGDLQAIRNVYEVRSAPAGWRLFDTRSNAGAIYVGRDACPPA